MKKILAFLIVLLSLTLCLSQNPEKYTVTRESMDTQVTITVYHTDEKKANKAIESGFQKIEELSKIFNIYDPESEASRLNQDKKIENPSKHLFFLVSESLKYSKISDGAFDITVQPILDLYKNSFQKYKRPPTEPEITSALDFVGSEKIHVEENMIQLKEGMKLTFGANAKGYIIDEVILDLQQNGIETALVDAGGDMRAIGVKPNGAGFNIALRNPRDKSEYLTSFTLLEQAVTTSGDYERYYINKSMNHIVNPKTGKSQPGVISATVTAKTALEADSLSTTLMVLGPEKGLKLIESIPNVEMLLVTEDKKIITSSGWPKNK